jgi:hypothetical protein
MARRRNKLNIGCTDSDCKNGLHCFKATETMVSDNRVGRCRECEATLVDWPRLHSRNLGDVRNTFESLKREKVRHFFWHIVLTQRAINHSKRKGKAGLRTRVRKHLLTSIGPAEPWHDGFQTPMPKDSATVIPYGQHATATCCRKCLEYWHGIPQGVALSDAQLDYLTELLCLYIEDRIPNLTEFGERIPHIR